MENLGGNVNASHELRLDAARQVLVQTIFRVNSVLQGEVLELLGGGSVLLGVGSHRVPADSAVELQLGQKFTFQVLENQGKIAFKILPEQAPPQPAGPPTSYQFFQQTAGKDAPLGETFGKLAQALLALVGEPATSTSSQTPKLPGKLPLDASMLGFLREAAQGLTATLRAEFAQSPTATPAPATPLGTAPLAQLAIPFPTPKSSLADVALSEAIPVLLETPTTTPSPSSLKADAPGPNPATPVPTPDPAGLLAAYPKPPGTIPATNLASALASPTSTPPPSMPATSTPAVATPSLSTLQDWISVLQRPELREALRTLAQHLESSSVREDVKPEAIRRNVEGTGIPIESHLRRLVEGESRENPEQLAKKDVKTLLLRVEGEVERTLRRLGQEVAPELRRALEEFGQSTRQSRESVESKQVQNALRQDSGEPLHFQIPYHDLDRLKTADLYYQRRQEKDKKGGGERTVHHIVFLLDMSRLGKLRIDALLRGSRIQIAVNTAKEDAVSFLRTRLGELEKTLESMGFEVGLLECRAGLPHAVAAERQEFDLRVLGERHIVDVEG